MAELFKCPACSAPLTYEGNPMQQCTFCNSTVIVPGSVINHSTPEQNAFGDTAAKIAEIKRLVYQNEKIQAVKLYRETFGTGLKESKDAVEEIARGAWTTPAASVVTGQMPPLGDLPGRMAEIKRLIDSGQKIEAIKIFRETFGTGLKEAKDAVEAMERGERLTMTNFQMNQASVISGDVAKKVGVAVGGSILGSLILAFVIIGAIIAGAFFVISRTITKSSRPFVPTPVPIKRDSVSEKSPEVRSIATELLKFGGEGIGAGKFTDNRTVAIDAEGRIYSADYSNGRVQAFDAEGKFVQQIVPDATRTVDSLGVDRKGNLFVLQGYDVYRVNRTSGEVYGKTRVDSATDLAVGVDGKIYVSSRRGDIAILNSEGAKISSVPLGKELGIQVPDQIAVDGAGNIFLVSGHDASIFKLAPDGRLLAKFGGRASGPNRDSKTMFMSAPQDIAVDSQGRLYASDVSSVRVFDPNGNYLNEFKATQVFGLAFSETDELYTAARPFVVKYKVTL